MTMNQVDILFSWIFGEDDAEYEALKKTGRQWQRRSKN